MKRQFFCSECDKVFAASGRKKRGESSIYGPTWKYVARCPECKMEVSEYKPESKSRKGGNGMKSSSAPSCPTGTCPFA